jgi:hypothetical protein
MKREINLENAHYVDIIDFAELHGYVRSPDAVQRESEVGSIDHRYGITLYEAREYIRSQRGEKL